MATITVPRTATYDATWEVIESNSDRMFVVEMDEGVFIATHTEVTEEWDMLSPGESLTVHAVCDTEAEAEVFRHTLLATAFTVRVIADGNKLAEDVSFGDDQEHTANAYFDSTVSLYRRTDLDTEVTVQLFDASGDVLCETTVTP